MQINKELQEYIEKNVFPEYDKNDKGHGIEHIKYVIKRSFKLVEENNLDVNQDMVYAIAAYHDIGHHIDSKTHEIISADIMYKDKELSKFFSNEELITIKEAIEDHRASAKNDPRSIYGKIVSSADRNNTVNDCLRRTYTYGKKLNPEETDEELFLRAYDVLVSKFGEGGYAKFYFKDKQYEDFLKELRELLKDKEKYINTQREYIKKLKEQHKLVDPIKIDRIKIQDIPAIIWGEKSKKAFIAVHGNMSNKEDEVIKILAEKVIEKGFQLISFDLPEHGERKENTSYLCNPKNCINDLKKILEYAKENHEEINLWACSMGAYFSLLTYKDEDINKCIFLSPVVNMKKIIDNMMLWSNVSEEDLKEKQEIKTEFGQTLYWDYYNYVKENPIVKWDKNTYILYGSKDNMQDENIIKEFTDKFSCKLTILENGEHYFHTEEQLQFYKNWLDEII